jgi:hypothetical protein
MYLGRHGCGAGHKAILTSWIIHTKPGDSLPSQKENVLYLRLNKWYIFREYVNRRESAAMGMESGVSGLG